MRKVSPLVRTVVHLLALIALLVPFPTISAAQQNLPPAPATPTQEEQAGLAGLPPAGLPVPAGEPFMGPPAPEAGQPAAGARQGGESTLVPWMPQAPLSTGQPASAAAPVEIALQYEPPLAYAVAARLVPGAAVALLSETVTYTLHVANEGAVTTTCTITLSAPGAPAPFTATVAPGNTYPYPLVLEDVPAGVYLITASVSTAEDPDVTATAAAGLNVVDRYLQVLAVTAAPAVLETAGPPVTLAVAVVNVGGVQWSGQVAVEVWAPGNELISTDLVPYTLASSLWAQDVALGTITTTGWSKGIYTVTVEVQDGDGAPIPEGAGFGHLFIGANLQSNSTAEAIAIVSGTVTATAAITTARTTPGWGGIGEESRNVYTFYLPNGSNGDGFYVVGLVTSTDYLVQRYDSAWATVISGTVAQDDVHLFFDNPDYIYDKLYRIYAANPLLVVVTSGEGSLVSAATPELELKGRHFVFLSDYNNVLGRSRATIFALENSSHVTVSTRPFSGSWNYTGTVTLDAGGHHYTDVDTLGTTVMRVVSDKDILVYRNSADDDELDMAVSAEGMPYGQDFYFANAPDTDSYWNIFLLFNDEGVTATVTVSDITASPTLAWQGTIPPWGATPARLATDTPCVTQPRCFYRVQSNRILHVLGGGVEDPQLFPGISAVDAIWEVLPADHDGAYLYQTNLLYSRGQSLLNEYTEFEAGPWNQTEISTSMPLVDKIETLIWRVNSLRYLATAPLTLTLEVTVPVSDGIYRYEETELDYTGSWTAGTSNLEVASRGGYRKSGTSGTRVARLDFVGSWVGVGLVTCNGCGAASIYVDGALKGTVDTQSPSANTRSRYYDLDAGAHTITVTAGPSKTIYLDYIDVWDGQEMPEGTFEEHHARVKGGASSSWNRAIESTVASGGAYYKTNTPARSLWLPFTGNSVAFQVLTVNEYGAALDMLIDGVHQGYFDLYNLTPITRTFSFSLTGDPGDPHVLQVCSYRRTAQIDRFDVPGNPPYYEPLGQHGVVRYEEDDPALRYNGGPFTQTASTWQMGPDDLASWYYRASSYKTSPTEEGKDKVSLTFTGSWVGVGLRTRTDAGHAKILIDGASQGIIDTYSRYDGTAAYYYSLGTTGTHTITVVVEGTKSITSSSTGVFLDYIDVWDGEDMITGTVQENDARVFRSDDWGRHASAAASGGYYYSTSSTGRSVWFPFTGDSVTYQALTVNEWYNKVEILIDGVRQGYFSLYNPTTITRTFSFSLTGGANAPHVVQVRAYRGTATVDRFVVPQVDEEPYEPPERLGVVRYQEDDPALRYNGVPFTQTSTTWSTDYNGLLSAGYFAKSDCAGQCNPTNTVELTFEGDWVGVGFLTCASCGAVEIEIDGVSHGLFDTYSTATNVTSTYYLLASTGTHTLTVVITTSDPVYLDYIDVWDGTEMTTGTFEEDDARVSRSGDWGRYQSSIASGGFYYRTNTSGRSVWFSFTGDSVDYQAIAYSGGGQVEILLDGESQGITFSLYNASTITRTFSFTVTDGPHVLQVRRASGYVTVDAFGAPAMGLLSGPMLPAPPGTGPAAPDEPPPAGPAEDTAVLSPTAPITASPAGALPWPAAGPPDEGDSNADSGGTGGQLTAGGEVSVTVKLGSTTLFSTNQPGTQIITLPAGKYESDQGLHIVADRGNVILKGITLPQGASWVWNLATVPAAAWDGPYAEQFWPFTATHAFHFLQGGSGNCWIHTIPPYDYGESYQVDTEHVVPKVGVTVLTDTFTLVPTITTGTEEITYTWAYELVPSQHDQVISYTAVITGLRPGGARRVADGTLVDYTSPREAGQVTLPPFYVAVPHLAALHPASRVPAVGTSVTYTLALYNPGLTTGTYTLTLAGRPAAWAELPPTVTLGAGGELTLPVTISVPYEATADTYLFALVAETDHLGRDMAVAELDAISLVIEPPAPMLFAPAGGSAALELTLTNAGERTLDYLTVTVPASMSAWLTADPPTLTTLPAHQAANFTLLATPAVTLAGYFQGYVGIASAEGATAYAALTVYVTATATGTVVFTVTDELVPVTGAEVTLARQGDPVSGQGALVFQGATGEAGLITFTGIPTGSYRYQVNAPGYAPYWGGEEVGGGIQGIPVPLWSDFVDYEWTVTETEYPDEYDVYLTITYRLGDQPLLVPCGPWLEVFLEEATSYSGQYCLYNPTPIHFDTVDLNRAANLDDDLGVEFADNGHWEDVVGNLTATITFTRQPSVTFPLNYAAGDLEVVGTYSESEETWNTVLHVLVNPSPTLSCTCTLEGDRFYTRCHWPHWPGDGGGYGGADPPPFGGWDPIMNPPHSRVQVRLSQQATLPRQAFWADLVLTAKSADLTNIAASLSISSTEGITLAGFTVDPAQAQWPELPAHQRNRWRWTLIPGPCLGGEELAGKDYYVAAHVEFDAAGQHFAFTTAQARINVRPQPRLFLSYYLPDQVQEDNPFSMLLAVQNWAYGPAHNFSFTPPVIAPQMDVITWSLDLGDLGPHDLCVGYQDFMPGFSGTISDVQVGLHHRDLQGLELNPLILSLTAYIVHSDTVEVGDWATEYDPEGAACPPPEPIVPAPPAIPWVDAPPDTRAAVGERAVLDYSVRNLGTRTITVTLVAVSAHGWEAQVASALVLATEQQVAVPVTVTVPVSLPRGLTDTVTLWALAADSGCVAAHDAARLLIKPAPDDQVWGYPCIDCTTSHDFERNRGGAINTRTGNHTYQQQDLSIAALGGPLRFIRTYSSQGADYYQLPLGPGWQHNYNMRLIFPADPGGEEDRVIFDNAEGSRLRFEISGTTYLPFPGVRAALTSTVQAYTVTTPGQFSYVFDPQGRLLREISAQGHVISLTYSVAGQLERVSDASGERYLDLEYDAQGRLITITDPISRQVRFGYDAQGNLAVVTDTRDLTTTMTYTTAGGLTGLLEKVGDANGHIVEQTRYDAEGRADRQWNELGSTLAITYTEEGVVSFADPRGTITGYDYSVGGVLGIEEGALGSGGSSAYDHYLNQTGYVDARGNSTGYGRDQWGLVTSVTDAYEHDTVMGYDDRNLTTFTDARGNATHYGYDDRNNLVSTTNALGQTTSYTYSDGENPPNVPAGLLVEMEDPLGHSTYYCYDELGQMSATAVVSGSTRLTTTYEYDAVGRLIRTIDPAVRVTASFYDAADHVTRTVENCTAASWAACRTVEHDPAAPATDIVTGYAYDRVGNRVRVTNTLDLVTLYEYDAANRIKRVVENYDSGREQNEDHVYNVTTRYGYDAASNQTHVTDTLDMVTRTFYDQLNRPVTMTVNFAGDGQYDPAYPDRNVSTYYQYDTVGNQVMVINGLGSETRREYDKLNRLTKVIANYQDGTFDPDHPDVDVVTEYGYDWTGNPVTVTTALGVKTITEYDELNRPRKVTENYVGSGVYNPQYPDRNIITRYTYDDAGNRTAVGLLGQYTTTYTYNDLGRVKTATDPLNHTITYTYDVPGNLHATIEADGAETAYEYDALGRQTAVIDPLGNTTHYAYDSLGRRVAVTDAAEIVTHYEYDILGRLVGVTENCVSGAPADEQTNVPTSYAYDVLGNVTTITNANGYTTTYTYDELSRVLTERDPLGHTWSYAYDALGRRSVVTDATDIATVYTYDDLGRLLSVAHGGAVTATYSYDALGNRVGMGDATGVTAYAYDDLGRVLVLTHSVTTTVAYTVAYGYDGRGLRTLLTYPDGTRVTSTYDLAGRLTAVEGVTTTYAAYDYDAANRLISATLGNGVQSRYDYDAAGHMLAITHIQAGDLLARFAYTYDAVGNLTRAVETVVAENDGGPLGSELPEPPASPEPFRLYLPLVPRAPTAAVAERPAPGVAAVPPSFDPLAVPGGHPALEGSGAPIVREKQAYRASFDVQGLRYSPKERLVEAGAYYVDFHLVQVRSGQTKLFHPGSRQNPPSSPPGNPDLVRYDRGEYFREEYLVTAGGVEQRFVFPQPFPVDGDLEIEANLQGNLELVLQDTGEIAFLSPSGEVVSSYGRAIVEEACGERLVAALELHGAHLRIVVPQEWLERACFPVLVDPLIGLNFAVSTQPISGNQERTSVAYGGAGTYLAAWHGPGNGSDVFAQVLSAEGALVSETVTLDDRSGNQQYPDAAGNAAQGTYLVVWQHDAGMWLPNRDIYAQRVEHGGTLTGTRIAVYTGTYNQEYPAVAWNPNDDEYLVVWQSYNALTGLYGIYGQVIEESGGLSGTAQAIFTSTAQLAYPDVAFNVSDTQYLVLWQEYSSGGTGTPNWNVRGRIVAAAGTPTIAAFDVITASNDQTLPAATYSLSDTAYLVAWQHYSGTGDLNDVRARWIDRLGGLDDAFAVAAGSDDQRAPDVSYGAVWGESLVVWERQPNPGMMYWDVYGQRVSRSGSLVGGVVPVADGSMDQRYPAVAYSPETGEYLPAWQDYHSGSNWDVYAQRVDADGDLDGAEILVSAQPAAESQDAPAVAYGSAAGQHLVVWTDDRNGNDDIYGQFVADGGALVDEAFVIANASNYSEQSPAVAYDADDDEYLVVWSRRLPPLQNDTWNIYAQRVAGDGTLPSGILAICAASSDQTVPTVAYNAATGHFLVTWQDARGKGTFDVYARAVEGGSGTLGDEFLVYAGEEYQYAPAVAANAVDGEYVVVWQEGSGGDIYGQRTLTETTTEDAFAITTAAGDQQAPAVVFDAAAGAYLVAWADYRSGTSWDIYAQRVATDGLALGAVLAVATGPADQQDPAVAGNAATGEYAVAWQEGTGAEADVYGRLLGRGAELLGGVEVLCAADYTQEGPAVAAGGQGRFLAVWADYRSGTGDPDVAGQVATGYTVVVEYTYDGLYRLVGAAYNDGTGYAYSYDAVGNRLALTRTTQVVTLTTYSYDAADRLITVTRGGVATGYDWSDRGELLADGMQEYAWDAAGRLVGVSVTGGPEVTYVYDGANDRVALGVAGVTTTYVVDPLSPVDGVPQVLVATTGGASTRHLYGLDLLGQTQGITTTYLGYDALSVRLHLDEEGAIAAQYRYGPFGEVEGAEPEGYGYTGEQWHGDLDLLYLRARYYAPEVGRFVSRDEWPGTPASPASQHRFAYAQNNPVNHADPMGQWILLEEEGVLNAGTIWAQPYGVFGVRYDENGNLVILYGGYRFINWQEIAIANFINTCDTKWLIGGGGGSANAWVGWSVQDSAGQLGYYYRAKGIHPIYLSMIIMGAAASSPPPGWGGGIFYPEGLPPGADYSARVGYFETLWDAAARAAQAAAAPTQNNEPPQLIRGRIVEQIVRQRNGLPKNSTKVYATVDGKQRGTYPDSITATEVHEIKDVNEVYLSTQLKTEIQYAKDIGRTFVLHVRPNGLTTIYQPVIEAIQRAGGRIEYDVRP